MIIIEVPCNDDSGKKMGKRVGVEVKGNLLFGTIVGWGKNSILVEVERI